VDKTSVSLTQLRSEFEKWIRADRPAIGEAALGFFSCAKLSLDARNGQSVTSGFTSSNWGSLCVATIALGSFPTQNCLWMQGMARV